MNNFKNVPELHGSRVVFECSGENIGLPHWLLPGKKYIIVSESVLHYKHKILQMGRYRRG